MMSSKAKLLLLAALGSLALYACSKYKDPPPASPPEELQNLYCNDPRAVNYNWGFPGKPDNDVCVYPVDSFLGSWVLTDTVYLPNGNISAVLVKNLDFSATEDTLLTHMAVTGWCGGTTPFYLTANKYKRATVDTLLEGTMGQYLCNSTDTLGGLVTGYQHDTLRIDFTLVTPGGTTYHKGTAIRP